MWSITYKIQYARCFLLVCMILACMGFTSKTYFQKHSVTADESAFIFRQVPEKIIAVNDSILVFYTDRKIIFANYRSGKIKHLLDVNELIDRSYIMRKYFDFDTTDIILRRNDSIFLHDGRPGIQIFSIAKNSDTDLFVVFSVNTFRMRINGEDTFLDHNFNIFSALFKDKKKFIKNISPLDIGWGKPLDERFRTPMQGLNVANTTIYIAYELEPSDPREILSSYSTKTLAMTAKQPGIRHTVFEKAQDGASIPTYFNFLDIDSEHYVNNVTKVYNLLTEKELFDCKSYFRQVYVTYFFSPIDKEKRKWFINYYSLPDTVNYHSKTNRMKPWIAHEAIIDIVNKQVLYDTILANQPVFCRYKNKFIAIEENKKDKKYYYVVYNL